MGNILSRQIAVLRQRVSNYHEGVLSLNALIQDIEGVNEVLGREDWKDAIFPILLSMEQINALAINSKQGLSEADKVSIRNSLLELESAFKRFEDIRE